MTIAFYHGSPGSYKTASMVKDWFIPALTTKRDVYTNIRGCEPSEHVYVMDNTDIVKALFTASDGALFLIDELGQVFNDIDAKKYRCLDSARSSDENGTIEIISSLPVLFDKHRHFGFDIIGTAPSYKRVPQFFRDLAEFGYKHKNLASLGLKGFYLQGEHLGDDTGSSSAHFTKKSIKRMPKKVFAYYQSTAIGKHKDSAIKSPLWKSPSFIILGLIVAFVGYWSIANFSLGGSSDGTDKPEITKRDTGTKPTVTVNNVAAGSTAHAGRVSLTDHFNSVVSDTTVAIRGIYASQSLAVLTVGNCEKQMTLTFRPDSRGYSSDGSFTYNFNDSLLRYLGSPLAFAGSDCVVKEQVQEASKPNLSGMIPTI